MDFSKTSAVILVKNGGQTLQECLESLNCFDEIVLLDNQSSDNTLEIATTFKKTFPNLAIHHSEFIGFGALKNLAVSYAKNEWIFLIDADEVLEKDCLEEFKTIHLKQENILALPRKNLYKGEWIKACGWYPDYVLRVFNKSFTRFNDNAVHESLLIQPNAEIIKTQNGLKHYAYESIYTLLEKMQKYSNLWAQQNLHKKSSMGRSIIRSLWKFFRDYFLKKGFLYGYKGFVISFCNALGVFFKYAKLYELTRKIPTCSLIITTYNSENYLRSVLQSVKNLDYLPDEVLIANDGSTEETALCIKEFQKTFPCPLKHIWQEDEGFRLNTIRNKAINAAKGEYIIIVDGDMILESHFIKDHLDFAKRKVFLQGSRNILSENLSKKIMEEKQCKEKLLPRTFKSMRLPILSKFLYKISKTTACVFDKKDLIRGVRGCNMSFFKQDWQNINGFNENFKSWGRDDSEFVARFLFNGGELRRLKFKGIAYHLYHKENDKATLSENHAMYLEVLRNKTKDWKNQ